MKKRKIDVNILDSSAIALSIAQGNPLSSMLMVWDLIEEKTKGTAHKAIEELLNYENEEVWIEKDGSAEKVPMEEVKIG